MLWADQPAPAAPAFRPTSLEAKFVAPPFSVLDTRQGYWQDRRRAWLSLGIQSELGRGADLLSLSPAEQARARWAGTTGERLAMERQREPGYRYDSNSVPARGAYMGKGQDGQWTEAQFNLSGNRGDEPEPETGPSGGTSIFDPVLCELMYRWFAPEGGHVLDPFAGGSVRGIVAAKLGHPYTGIDLSGAQLAANREQAERILLAGEPVPQWHEGDSRQLVPELARARDMAWDMVLTCPPYFDLEVYSDHPADLSAMAWPEFVEGYAAVMEHAANGLRDERFAVWVVSEVRDAQGYCRGLVPLTIRVAEEAGLRLYNEAVLINNAGSLPLRVTKYMEASRKLGRAHQNVLVFVKGKPPRGWSWDRAAPPSPQLGLFGEDHEPGHHATQADADECSAETYGEAGWPEPDPEANTAPPEQAPLRLVEEAPEVAPVPVEEEPAAPEPSWASGPVGEWRALEDGGYVDTGSGEVVRELPGPERYRDPASMAAWELRRGREWNPGDPNRPCWGCGEPPIGHDRDGGPRYSTHSHNAQVITMFGTEG
jgi:hypothetical protein